MPFLLSRTASVLVAAFLLTGPSAPAATSASDASGRLATSTATSCPAHWTDDELRVPSTSLPAGLNSQITSVAALSPTDEWMLITRTDKQKNTVSAVYHLAGAERQESTGLAENEQSFGAKWILARSDTNVWVVGLAHGALQAWEYDGSRWTDHAPARYPYAGINTAALDSKGILYLAGTNTSTHRGIILGYDGSRWADLSPANPPYDYEALAVTAGGTLIAAGGGRHDGTLQERSGGTWLTVSLSGPVNAITRVSVAPGGIVYGVGSRAGDELVFVKQLPGSRSATVFDPPMAEPGTASTAGVVALGLDVWLLGEDEPHQGWHHSWITHDDRVFLAAGRRISQVTGSGAVQPCWYTAASRTGVFIRSLPSSSWCARCGCDTGQSSRPGGAQDLGCSCPGLPRWQDDQGATSPQQAYPDSARSSRKGRSPATASPHQPARSRTLPQSPAIRPGVRLLSPLSPLALQRPRLARSPAPASRHQRAARAAC
jgi:hypothetical protein